MSHFLGTPAKSHIWAWVESQGGNELDDAKKLRKRLLSGPTVDIYVGPEKKHWSLHKNLLCHHSSYFETELHGHEVPKKKADTKDKLELPDDDPRGFALLVKWLYQGHLEDASELSDEAKYEYAVACNKLYQLCDRFDMILLKNLAMDAYRQNLHSAQLVPDPDEINEIYRASPPNSPFKKLMTKIAARQIMDPGVDKDAQTYRACFENNPTFAVEMVNAIRYMSGGMLFDDPTAPQDECVWHDHSDGSSCNGKPEKRVQLVNGVTPGLQPMSPNIRRAHQTPLIAELSSERPTPRKLDIRHSSSPAKPRQVSAKQKPNSPLPNGVPARSSASSSINGQTDKGTPKKRNVTAGPLNHPQETISPIKFGGAVDGPEAERPSPKKPPRAVNGAVARRAVSDTSAFPGKATFAGNGVNGTAHVNGIVRQFNGVNGSIGESESHSVTASSETLDKKQPPKLNKRKAPG